MADDLRVPVSNLVRNVLEEAFSVAEQVSGDLGSVLEDVMEGAERASRQFERYQRRQRERAAAYEAEDADPSRAEHAAAPGADRAGRSADAAAAREPAAKQAAAPATDLFEGIVAWQPVVLHAPQYCARTGRKLPAGARAHAAIGPHGLTGLYVHEDALPVD